MAHSTVRVEGVASPEQLSQLFATAARLGVRVSAGRIGPRHVHLELDEAAPVGALEQALVDLGLKVEVAPGEHLIEGLSPRERELIVHLSSGLQLKEAAQRMGVQTHTVREYWLRVKRKLDVKTVGQAVSIWSEHGHDHDH